MKNCISLWGAPLTGKSSLIAAFSKKIGVKAKASTQEDLVARYIHLTIPPSSPELDSSGDIEVVTPTGALFYEEKVLEEVVSRTHKFVYIVSVNSQADESLQAQRACLRRFIRKTSRFGIDTSSLPVVLTKNDVCPFSLSKIKDWGLSIGAAIRTSTVTGEGIDEALNLVVGQFSARDPDSDVRLGH